VFVSRSRIYYIMDAIMFVAFVSALVSGLALLTFGPRPHGVGWGRGGEPVGERACLLFQRHDWVQLHNWAGIAFAALVLFHLALHWRWIVSTSRRLFGR